MAIQIDDKFISELNLGDLPEAEKTQLVGQIRETLEMRVGMKIAEAMSEAQLKEFEGFMEAGDEKGAMEWLSTNYPSYRQVVKDELERLKSEIKKDADKIRDSLKPQ